MAIVAAASYATGAVICGFAIARAASRVEKAIFTKDMASEAISDCLQYTVKAVLTLWLGVGLALAAAGFFFIMPTLTGLQTFPEAALLVTAPAMAWSYWTGKLMLLREARDVPGLSYHGRQYSIGSKIAMVFIGFFIVSIGALVQLVTAHVLALLRSGHTNPDQIALEIGRYSLMIAGATSLFFAIATYCLARDVTTPLSQLVRVANSMAEGNFDIAPRIFADDEVGTLGERFGATRSQLRDLVSRVTYSGGAITTGVRVMREGTDSLLNGAHEQSGMTEQSVATLQQVREDTETVVMAVGSVTLAAAESSATAAQLQASFEKVALRTDELFRSVEKSSSGTAQIDASARETLERATGLSSISSDLLAFVTEMEATIRNIQQTAEETRRLAHEVSEHARTGQNAVERTVNGIRTVQGSATRTSEAFDALQASLGQIGQVLTFIDEVASKTHLLSLNAAIIAAHAGRNEFGFSIIADEIGLLAERTRESTKEISGILRAVQPVAVHARTALRDSILRVDDTVALAQNATISLATILNGAERSMTMSEMTAQSLNEQSRATQHLQQVTVRMTEHVEEIHRATRGQAEATRLLAIEAEHVSEIAEGVRHATSEQMVAGSGIARSMEQIAIDVAGIRDRLERQLEQADQIASASKVTLTIAKRNNQIAEHFSDAIEELATSGRSFDAQVQRFRI